MQKTIKNKSEEKVVKAEYHSLYIEEVPEKREHIKKDLYRITPARTKFRVYIDDFMDEGPALHAVFDKLWSAGKNDELAFRINSSGGLINEGLQFFNLIENKFNGRTLTFLDTKAYSMGALLFCAGDTRVITPHSDLMFHDYSGGAVGKGGEIETRVQHTSKKIRDFFKRVILEKGFLTEEEFNQMVIGQDYWFDAEEMCKRGIATHVMVNGERIKAKKYLKSLNKKKKGKKK